MKQREGRKEIDKKVRKQEVTFTKEVQQKNVQPSKTAPKKKIPEWEIIFFIYINQ